MKIGTNLSDDPARLVDDTISILFPAWKPDVVQSKDPKDIDSILVPQSHASRFPKYIFD